MWLYVGGCKSNVEKCMNVSLCAGLLCLREEWEPCGQLPPLPRLWWLKFPPYQQQILFKNNLCWRLQQQESQDWRLSRTMKAGCQLVIAHAPLKHRLPPPPLVKYYPFLVLNGTKFQKCDCVWPIMILERFIFNKVNTGHCSLLASSRRLLSGNNSVDAWRLKSSYGWFLPVQTRSNENIEFRHRDYIDILDVTETIKSSLGGRCGSFKDLVPLGGRTMTSTSMWTMPSTMPYLTLPSISTSSGVLAWWLPHSSQLVILP